MRSAVPVRTHPLYAAERAVVLAMTSVGSPADVTTTELHDRLRCQETGPCVQQVSGKAQQFEERAVVEVHRNLPSVFASENKC